MPIPATIIKYLPLIKWGLIATFVVSILSYGAIQHMQLEKTKSKLAISEQNAISILTALDAERRKSENRRLDAESKQKVIEDLTKVRVALREEYADLKAELDRILNEVIPNINTDGDLTEANRVVQKALTDSYKCIEAATRGVACSR